MTNDEIIKILKEFIRQRYELHVHSFTMDEVFTNVISSLEENAKLKSDIEQLRWISYENIKTENDTHNRTIKEKESEIEQLKSELEQSVKLQNVLSKLLKCSEFARCYMCDNSMKNITLDGKNNGCDGSCYHANEYTEKDLLDKIKRELNRTKGQV